MIVALNLWHVAAVAAAVPVALVLGIAFAPAPIGAWCSGVFRAGDDMLAALFGGDGRHSVSAYCGMHQANGTSWICGVALRKAIDLVFGAGHCLGAAKLEQLI